MHSQRDSDQAGDAQCRLPAQSGAGLSWPKWVPSTRLLNCEVVVKVGTEVLSHSFCLFIVWSDISGGRESSSHCNLIKHMPIDQILANLKNTPSTWQTLTAQPNRATHCLLDERCVCVCVSIQALTSMPSAFSTVHPAVQYVQFVQNWYWQCYNGFITTFIKGYDQTLISKELAMRTGWTMKGHTKK